VSDLRYRSDDSVAQWTPHAARRPAEAFFYRLSVENGTAVLSGRVADPELRLPRLEKGAALALEVWEQCGARWESERARLWLQGAEASAGFRMRAAGPGLAEGLSEGPLVQHDDVAVRGLVPVCPLVCGSCRAAV